MAFFDFPLEKLQTYQAPENEPADFDAFWKRTLAEAAAFPLNATFAPVDEPFYRQIRVCDVTFNGFGGQAVKGWFIEPADRTSPGPALVKFLGYGGGRGFPFDHVLYPLAGVSVLVMDSRGQGSWSPGATRDDGATGPAASGVMTRGIDSPDTYYYRRLFTDAARAVEAVLSHPRVDPKRVGLEGGSQGGGITLAAAALCNQKVKVALPDVPFLCHFRRATTLVNSMPYGEIGTYLKSYRGRTDEVFGVLDYFDGINFARRISARCLFSVGLMDDTCPPSTVYAAYNRVPAPKQISVYDFNAHEGGGGYHNVAKLRFVSQWL